MRTFEETTGPVRRTGQQKRSERNRAAILKSARKFFSEQGFEAASIRDIASDANTTHSMIKYYFGTKDALWRETVADMFRVQNKAVALTKEEEGLSAKDRLTIVTRRYVKYCAEHPEHARITISETIRGGERLDWMVKEFVQGAHDAIRDELAELTQSGDLPDIPHEFWVYIISGMAQQPFVLAAEAQALFNVDMQGDDMVEAYADSLVALLFRSKSK